VWMRGEPDTPGLPRRARRLTRRSVLPGGRSDIRDRSVTVAMHMLRRVLLGESDELPAPAAGADAVQ